MPVIWGVMLTVGKQNGSKQNPMRVRLTRKRAYGCTLLYGGMCDMYVDISEYQRVVSYMSLLD